MSLFSGCLDASKCSSWRSTSEADKDSSIAEAHFGACYLSRLGVLIGMSWIDIVCPFRAIRATAANSVVTYQSRAFRWSWRLTILKKWLWHLGHLLETD